MNHHTATHADNRNNGGAVINYTREGESLMDAFERAERTWPGEGVMTFLAPHRTRGR